MANVGGLVAIIIATSRNNAAIRRSRHTQYKYTSSRHQTPAKEKTIKRTVNIEKKEKSGIEAVFEKNIGIGVDG